MKTKKQIQKELEKFKNFYLAHNFVDRTTETKQLELLSEWIGKNCGVWDRESCAERILSLQWVLEYELKLPRVGNYKLEEFVETLNPLTSNTAR